MYENKEPAPTKWQTWAEEEDQHQKTTFKRSPQITHNKITRPLILPNQDKTTHYKTKPSQDQLDFLSFDPPKCFCKKEAYRSYTLEYGPILECASYGIDESENYKAKFTCGFHVHENSWLTFIQDIKNGFNVNTEYPELRSCPLYNFTFCILFHCTNSFNKIPPSVLPECFCGHPVKLREKNQDDIHKIFFNCKNSNVEGVKKCSWYLNAKEVAFMKPKYRLHTNVDFETYQRHNIKSTLPVKTQHHNDLLATLSAKPTQPHNLVVPTSVLAKKQPSTSLSSSSSTSTSSTVSSPTFQKPGCELEEDAAMLEISILHVKRDAKLRIKEMENQLLKYMDKSTRLERDLKDQLNKLKLDLEHEFVLRVNGQEKLSTFEAEVVNLRNEQEKAIEDLAKYRQEVIEKYGKEEEQNKCRVCFSKNIEFVLTPCFHYAYCELCAYKLKECAICRMDINGVHKIFNC